MKHDIQPDFFRGEFSGERSKLKMEFVQLEELLMEKKNTPVFGGMNLTTRSYRGCLQIALRQELLDFLLYFFADNGAEWNHSA